MFKRLPVPGSALGNLIAKLMIVGLGLAITVVVARQGPLVQGSFALFMAVESGMLTLFSGLGLWLARQLSRQTGQGGEAASRARPMLLGVLRAAVGLGLLASLALCGVPPFAGFFSKDEIIHAAWSVHPVSGLADSTLCGRYHLERLIGSGGMAQVWVETGCSSIIIWSSQLPRMVAREQIAVQLPLPSGPRFVAPQPQLHPGLQRLLSRVVPKGRVVTLAIPRLFTNPLDLHQLLDDQCALQQCRPRQRRPLCGCGAGGS